MGKPHVNQVEIEQKLRQLTQRQCEILYWVCQGKNYEEVGLQLDWAESLVQKEMSEIYRIFGFKPLTREEKRQLLLTVICPIHQRLVSDPNRNCAQRPIDVKPPAPDPEIDKEVIKDQQNGLIPLDKSLIRLDTSLVRVPQQEDSRTNQVIFIPPQRPPERHAGWLPWVLVAILAIALVGTISYMIGRGLFSSQPGIALQPPTAGAPAVTPVTAPTQTPLVVVHTVVATAVPTSPTSIPTSPPIYTATPRPIPTATLSPDTPAGTILSPGQYWRQGDLALVMQNSKFNVQNSCVFFEFYLYNRSDAQVIVTITPDMFSATDNMGRAWKIRDLSVGVFCPDRPTAFFGEPISSAIPPGKDFAIPGYHGWTASFEGPVTDPKVTSVTITVTALSRFSNAKWSVPIGR